MGHITLVAITGTNIPVPQLWANKYNSYETRVCSNTNYRCFNLKWVSAISKEWSGASTTTTFDNNGRKIKSIATKVTVGTFIDIDYVKQSEM